MAHEMHNIFGKIPIERARFLSFQSAGGGKVAHRKHTIHHDDSPVSTRRRQDDFRSTSVFEAPRSGWLALLLLAIAFCSLVPVAAAIPHSRISPSKRLTTRAPTLNGSLLEVLEVAPPVESVTGAACQETLMVYSFANSYGQPFVGPYTPPTCAFNRIIWNLTVTSAGRQFDRLGVVFFNDTEIFRTSTAEPTSTGIEWTYLKDMSNYLSLFKQPQTLIFDLGNIVNDVYTAPFNVTLTAAFLTENVGPTAADVILPVSAMKGSTGASSVFNLPDDNATTSLSVPRNAQKAIFSIASAGQSTEEFWWSNVLSSDTDTFPTTGTLYGYSPFREVQLYIDGMLAGVAWPFPVIFTGGIVPGFWRPVVGIDAFDLREDEIDVSPFLPLLCDGNAHTFEIRVAGIDDDGQRNGVLTETVGSYWVVTGKLFLWLDNSTSTTTGGVPSFSLPAPTIALSQSVTTTSNGTNQTLTYEVDVHRELSISSVVNTSKGPVLQAWKQSLSYSNKGNFTAQGLVQITDQSTTGSDVSASGYSRSFSYPLLVYSAYYQDAASGNLSINGTIDRSKNVLTIGEMAFPSGLEYFETHNTYGLPWDGSDYKTRQNGSATYFSSPAAPSSGSSGSTGSSGSGTTEQDLTFSGVRASVHENSTVAPDVTGETELYHRHILAVNGSVVMDDEMIEGSMRHDEYPLADQTLKHGFAKMNSKDMIGRGQGGKIEGQP